MLREAGTWRGKDDGHDILRDPFIARYISGWGRSGDTGVVAEDEQGQPLGAAWYRFFSPEEHGFGFVSQDVPELTVAVRPDARGRGTGTALLEALLARARTAHVSALSLSVEEDNPALALYRRLGFVCIGRVGNALTMQRDLAEKAASSSAAA